MSVSTGASMPPLPPPGRVAAQRAKLWDAGFRPVPIYNAGTGRPSAGKAPKGNAWQERARENPPPCTSEPADPDALNTGILCDGLRAIDIDVDDPEIASKIKLAVLDRYHEAPIRFRTNSARCLLLYRAADGEPGKRVVAGQKGKVEVLGRGQQFVAFGLHDSGAYLQWVGDTPGDISAAELPPITEDDVGKILAYAGSLLGAAPEKAQNGVGAVSVHGLAAADALQVNVALSAIGNTGPPDWEFFNRIGMVIWAATSGSMAGMAAFHAWAQGNDCYDPAETQARWDHYRTSPPTRIGAGTLFHMAKSARQKQPDDDLGELIPPTYDDQSIDSSAPPIVETPTAASNVQSAALYVLDQGWTEANIPKRPWVAPGYLLRGSITVLSGPGSAGKSSLVIAWTAAHALGREFGRFRSYSGEPIRVLNYNVEDDIDEQKRRYSAMCKRLGASTDSLMQNLTICGPNDVGTLLSLHRDGGIMVNTKAMDELEKLIIDCKPEVVWLDPFVELHGAEENDNTAIRLVLARFRAISRTYNMAIGLLHHARKGASIPGDPDSIRGASAIVGAGRVALTVNVMTDQEAEDLGVPKNDRRDYFRLDDAKKNYSRIQDAEWFERQEYELANGDRVAVPIPWSPPLPGLDQSIMAKIEQAVSDGTPLGPWSPRLSADDRSAARFLSAMGITSRQAQRAAIDQTISAGLIAVGFYSAPRKSKAEPKKGLMTADGKPRSVEWINTQEHVNHGDCDD